MIFHTRRIFVLTFLIAPFLLLIDAANFAQSPPPTVAHEEASVVASPNPTTTTTLASSNAPATITSDARVNLETGEATVAAVQIPSKSDGARGIQELVTQTWSTTAKPSSAFIKETPMNLSPFKKEKELAAQLGVKNVKQPMEMPTETDAENEHSAGMKATSRSRTVGGAVANHVAELASTTATTTTNSLVSEDDIQQSKRLVTPNVLDDDFNSVKPENDSITPNPIARGHTATEKTVGSPGKVNIVDLYPVKPEDFAPIIRDSNAKLLQERTVFTKADAEEHRQNLMPNEVEDVLQGMENSTANRVNHLAAQPHKPSTHSSSISEFAGKLLADQDGVITEIEQKFHVSESAKAQTASKDDAAQSGSVFSRREYIHDAAAGFGGFIERRVKKSFDFPLHRAASDTMPMPHIDFASTKFNTDSAGHTSAQKAPKNVAGSSGLEQPPAAHPEFSTTKFFNSKELYSELLQHNRQRMQQKLHGGSSAVASAAPSTGASGRFIALNNQTFQVTRVLGGAVDGHAATSSVRLTPTTSTVYPATAAPSTVAPKKYQKELKRAKLLLKTMLPSPTKTNAAGAATVETTKTTEQLEATSGPAHGVSSGRDDKREMLTATTERAEVVKGVVAGVTQAKKAVVEYPASAAIVAAGVGDSIGAGASVSASLTTSSAPASVMRANPAGVAATSKSAARPIARPHILSRLQERINSLDCEILNISQDSHSWRGNETHELLLPIVSPENCKQQSNCTAMVISWEGEAEIQSGDVLIVEINDTLLMSSYRSRMNSAHSTQVYQVTRSGHEHCDVTEGILLDITPLVVDGRKLVTLYDKDLTEGVNLLIVVSELWGAQCVRLKVTTKTDNCGENADCSGKGICYSNAAMEEYECQCCSGFAGSHCEEIDACTPSPCTNNGICVDLSQGHEGNSYQCLCPYGYTGKNCQYEAEPCNSADCQNGGSCVGNSTHFRCDCMQGYTGPLCQHSLNECESSPCLHGICVDQEDGFRCFCQPGFAGELCNFEYNECESNPCQNGGECIDHIGSYECRCTKGYSGSRCEAKVDLCANQPCPAGHRCIDHGNEFDCECPGGQNGPDCNRITRTQCTVNPCTHGGTCWSSGESFYCACRPGYTGSMCEDEFVVETVISSSEFMVDDTSARNFNDKTFSSSIVLKSPIELHNAYFAAGVLAAAIFIVAIVVTICHCKVNQTYRKFSTRSNTFFPILGFGRRPKPHGKLNKHWLSGKGLGNGNPLRSSAARGHLPGTSGNQYTTTGSTALQQKQQGGQLQERPFQTHLAMNLENDMYYTVDFAENSQQSPLIK